MEAPIVILTGERGAGKSTACEQLVTLARARGYTCGGLITRRLADDQREVLEVASGVARRLTLPVAMPDGEPHTVVQGQYRFDPLVLEWAAASLTRALPCHLLVVDELGPLEIIHGRGWTQAFAVLADNGFALAVVVVRPELIAAAQARLPCSATSVLRLSEENRDQIPRALLQTLAAHHPPPSTP